MNEINNTPLNPALSKTAVSGSLTHIPLFQYESAVEAHKNTLDLLRIIQADKKELKEELEAAYREIDRLNGILNYR
jgi:iron uptake system EfeUOB component EfeO/EfeM